MLGGVFPQAQVPPQGVEEKGLLIETEDDEQRRLGAGEPAAYQTRFT